MIKVYAMAAIIALTNFTTWRVCQWKHDSQEKKIIIEQVENHNEDTIALQEHNRLMEEISRTHVAELDSIEPIRLPPITIYETANLDDCLALIDEHERMFNEAVGIANRVHFED